MKNEVSLIINNLLYVRYGSVVTIVFIVMRKRSYNDYCENWSGQNRTACYGHGGVKLRINNYVHAFLTENIP